MKHYIDKNGKVYGFIPQGIEVREMTADEFDAFRNPPPSPAPIPSSVTMRQARLALLGTGMLDAVSAGIESMPGADGAAARIEWEYAATVERDSPLINGLSVAIGMTDSQVDELFMAASKL